MRWRPGYIWYKDVFIRVQYTCKVTGYCLHNSYDDLKQITWRLWLTSLVHAVSVLVATLPVKIPLLAELWTRIHMEGRAEPQGLVESANAFLMEWLCMPWMNMIRRCLSPWPIHLLIPLATCSLAPYGGRLSMMPWPVDLTSLWRKLRFVYFCNYLHSGWMTWKRTTERTLSDASFAMMCSFTGFLH